MSSDLILTADFGTQSVRVILFNSVGTIVAKEKVEYVPYYSDNPGWAEQDPELYWSSMCKAIKKLKAGNKKDFSHIKAVVATTMRDTAVNVDKNGEVLRPTIIWLDQRMADYENRLYPHERLALKAVGMDKAVELIQMKGKSNWIIQNEPEIWKRTHKYLLLSGFINFRLTGKFVDSTACQIAHIPFDYKNQCWPSSMDFKWRVFGINRNMLPELIPAGGILGEISKKASKETGLPEGLVVIAGGSDKGCETLGTGCVDETSANISFGTTATIQTTTSKYIEAIKFLPPYPAIAKGTYNPEIEIFRGYWMISWFKKEFAEREMLEAAKKKISPEALLDKRLAEVPAGCQGLMLQPLWSPDILNPEAKGMILGFGDVHTRIHIYRAIIEGINYALLEGAEKIEKKTGKTIDWISVSGGGASSDAVCQITADMFNRPIHKPSTHETSGLGAAIIGFVGIKVYNSYPEAVSKMVHYKQVYQPQKTNAKIYHELYRDVYVKLYSRMKPFYKSIQKITGYPEM